MQAQIKSIVSIFGIGLLLGCGPTVPMQGGNKQANVDLEPAVSLRLLAGLKATETMSYSFIADSALQKFPMLRKPPETLVKTQVDRPLIKDQFVQGHSGETVSEDFTVSRLDQLDLLVVVDNSSSMLAYQDRLSVGMSSLLSHISNTDWQMMVTTTSVFRSRNPLKPTEIIRQYGCPRINSLDPSDKAIITHTDYLKSPQIVDAQFAWKVQVGETGDPIERGLLASVSGLAGECGDAARTWTRKDSHKAVVLLTDEENCGSDPDQNCDAEVDALPGYFLENSPGTQFFALLHDNDRYAECSDDGYIRKPDDYRSLIAATGGMEGNICKGDYQEFLKEISRNIHLVPRVDYQLSYAPSDAALLFYLNGQPWEPQYTQLGQTVSLKTRVPEDAKTLTIAYKHNPVPVLAKFPLSVAVDEATLKVRVNGTELARSDYAIEEGQLVFATKPKELAKVEAEYRGANGLLKSFPIPDDALLTSLEVRVNGQVVENYKMTGDTARLLVFDEAPTDGASLELVYETSETRTLVYPGIASHQSRVLEVKALDSKSQEPIEVKWDGKSLHFARDDVSSDRMVEVRYSLAPSSNEITLALAQVPLEGSLSIKASDLGAECIAKVVRGDASLLFPCPSETLGRLEISYDYLNQIETHFRIPGSFTSKARWEVKVDGALVTDYLRGEGNVISFPGRVLKADTLIEVKVWEPLRS